MQKLYVKYRPTHFNQGQGDYHLSYLYNNDREWYITNTGVKITDGEQLIPNDKYIFDSKGKKLAVVEYDETKITASDLTFDLQTYSQCATRVLSVDEAKSFIDNNTNCIKQNDGLYEVSSASTGLMGEEIKAVYLEIN